MPFQAVYEKWGFGRGGYAASIPKGLEQVTGNPATDDAANN
jgi:hypothetical protein